MKEIALEFINKIYDYGYEAYIVGGFVRDNLLGLQSKDFDITTNATPMELKNIFDDLIFDQTRYGNVTIMYKNNRFEVTTFREENDYSDNRHPNMVNYCNDLETDLKRRDFKINALCIDKDGNIIDKIDGLKDLQNRVIDTIQDPDISFTDDSLRMLRALRFSILLGFKLSNRVKESIIKNKYLLKDLSYTRKKYELDRIFASKNAELGIKILKKFDLIEILELDNIDRVKDYTDLVGIWSMINTKNYPFTKSEQELIKNVNIVYDMDNLDNNVLYKYGLYVNVLAGINKGIDKKDILTKYDNLPIKEKSEINVNANDICLCLNKKPGSFISEIYKDLEVKIINHELLNDKEKILNYIKNNY